MFLSQFSFAAAIEGWIKQAIVVCLRFLFRSFPLGEITRPDVKHILVVRQHDQLGDMLCAVPLLRALRTNFPDAHITLAASPVNFEIMRHHPYVNEILNYNKKLFLRSPSSFIEFLRTLRKRRYDLAIVPVTVSISLTSNLLAFVSRATMRLGAESLNNIVNPTSFLFNVRTSLHWENDPHRHQTLRNLDILKPLEIAADNLQTVIGITEEEKSEAARFLSSFFSEHKILIGFHPGAGKFANRWNAERFAETANQLCEKFFAAAVITAGPMDDEPVNTMLRHIRSPHLLVRRKSIRSDAAIVSLLNVFITNDTGIMHVAAATGVPTLSLFGPTDPLQWAPMGTKNRYIYGRNNDVNTITNQEVVDTACEMLSSVPPKVSP